MLIRKIQQPADFPATNVVDSYQESSSNVYNCNYINAIIESGSNENGSWTKLADGTMICRQTFTRTIVTDNQPHSGAYWGYISIFPNYPQPFVETPEAFIQCYDNDLINVVPYLPTETCASSANAYGYSWFNINKTITINVIAVGKWK